MALLVPNIGEIESLRYLISQNNFVADLQDTSPRNLVLKLFTSNTTPAEGDVPSSTAYFEPYIDGNTNGYGTTANTGYPVCVNNRTDQNYSSQYGILLNGSRWVIKNVGSGTTATYPEQTFTFTGPAGNIYGYYVTRATNMPVSVQGVEHSAGVGIGTTVTKGNNTDPCIGVVGNYYFTVDSNVSIDDLTLGQYVAGNAGIATGSRIIGMDRALKVVYIDKALVDNIQVATDPSITFSFGKINVANHGLVKGDIVYVAAGAGNTTLESNVYTVFDVPNADEFVTTPSMTATANGVAGLNTATLYSSIMYAERFTNGPYNIQNNGDQIKITLNVALD
tara:strand:- start:8961 stop:9968 length:1008 start_codon:yes stop_codon:yes gene_type:complete